MKVSIVIPVHNEEAVLEASVLGIVRALRVRGYQDWELWLVDNGSYDQTPDIAQRLSREMPQLRYLRLEEPGYGRAMQEGLLRARGEVLVNFDIDYWDVEFLVVAVHLMQIKYDIVIASKNLLLSRDRRGLSRRIASYVFRAILFSAFGLRVSDTHGIKAWRNSPDMQRYFRESAPSHHTYDTEIIIRAMHDGRDVLEVPIEVIETRASDRRLIHRIPRALLETVQLFFRLHRDRQRSRSLG